MRSGTKSTSKIKQNNGRKLCETAICIKWYTYIKVQYRTAKHYVWEFYYFEMILRTGEISMVLICIPVKYKTKKYCLKKMKEFYYGVWSPRAATAVENLFSRDAMRLSVQLWRFLFYISRNAF